MWIPGGLIYLAGALFVIHIWFQRLRRRDMQRLGRDADTAF